MSWNLTVSNKQKSGLIQTKDFVTILHHPVAIELITPTDLSDVKNLTVLGTLASSSPFVFAISWDGKKSELRLIMTVESFDLENVKNILQLAYPNVGIIGLPEIPWDIPFDRNFQVFDVSMRHGHFYVPFDTKKESNLITEICAMIQQTEYAYIQFVFQPKNLTSHLNRHENSIRSHYRMTQTDQHHDGRTIPNREKYGEFANNYSGIITLVETKKQSSQVLFRILGLYKSKTQLNLPFRQIQAAPIGNGLRIDHLEQYDIDMQHMFTHDEKQEKKTLINCDNQKKVLNKIDIIKNYLFPKEEKLLKRATSQYVGKTWIPFFQSYYTRKPLPFNIANTDEIHLIFHLPKLVHNLKTTRTQRAPQHLPDKEIFSLGNTLDKIDRKF